MSAQPREPDVVTAIELVIGTLDGKPLLPRIAGLDRGATIGGLVVLCTMLGEKIAGEDRPDIFRAALADLQAHQRLAALFGPRET